MRPKLRRDGKRTGFTITIPPRTLEFNDDVDIYRSVEQTPERTPERTPSPTLSDSDSLEFGSDDVSSIFTMKSSLSLMF